MIRRFMADNILIAIAGIFEDFFLENKLIEIIHRKQGSLLFFCGGFGSIVAGRVLDRYHCHRTLSLVLSSSAVILRFVIES